MKYVPYYRVSTAAQGKSGLGLSAQREIVHRFVKPHDELLPEFVEIESGKRADRPQLEKAIALAKQQGARLLIAKLDRLSRNVHFIFSLRNLEVDFVACDIPDANTLTVGIMAVLAQHERELIGERTRVALAAKKAQGFKLGAPNLTPAISQLGRQIHQQNARSHPANLQAAELIRLYRNEGLTYEAIARRLNGMGFRTRRGNEFKPMSVQRLNFINRSR
ncbi:recombinase family protein [Fibrella forsythiae]|uniref:Recombinase family protein n=1 Tax=Fibrella forsythiae TaxID=2817061 RepID=A0ABS3JSW8_9BACT|nr:recombinase family protein [Fibrella forsythiae]MBO0953112.1 recombinase family protein [Fibrella forsythiae]